MAVTPVEYLIKANDQFTPVMSRVAESIQTSRQRVDSMTKSAKASAGAFQALGSAMGGLPIAAQIGQFSALVQQMSQLNKQAQGSTAQMLAMRGGIIALAAAAGFTLVKSIIDVIYQTDQMSKAFDRAMQRSQTLEQRLNKVRDAAREEQLENIGLIRDPEQREQAEAAYFQSLQKELMGVESSLHATRKEVENNQRTWMQYGASFFIDVEQGRKALEQQQQQLEARQQTLQEERDAILRNQRLEQERAATIAENARLDALDQTVANMERQNEQLRLGNVEYQRQQELANARTMEERARIAVLQLEREQLQAAEEARQKEQQQQQQSIQASESYIQNLEAQRILLTQGQQAAEEYRARLAGVSEEAIAEGRQIQAEIDALKDAQKEAEPLRRAGQTILSAQETRLLTRATPRDDAQQQIAQSVKKANEQGKQQIDLAKQQLRAIQGLGRGIPVFSGN
jgi:hypothetical protein